MRGAAFEQGGEALLPVLFAAQQRADAGLAFQARGEHLQRGGEAEHVAAALRQRAASGVQQRAAAQGNHAVPALDGLLQAGAFQGAEGGFTLGGEDLRDGLPGVRLDGAVQVEEGQAQRPGQAPRPGWSCRSRAGRR